MPGLDSIKTILDSGVESFCYSGYQYFVDSPRGSVSGFGGLTDYWTDPLKKIQATSLFDVGSVTKALVTTTLFALAVQDGKVNLTDTVEKWDASWKGTRLGSLTLEMLLQHASGLVGWKPMYRDEGPWEQWVRSHDNELLVRKPWVASEYSDFGFMLLGRVAEKVYSSSLKDLLKNKITDPLKMTQTLFGPISPSLSVATEYRLERKAPLKGTVFDENSDFMGGVSGHAGVFSTASDLGVWASAWLKSVLGKAPWIRPDVAKIFSTCTGKVPASTWALGWDTRSAKGSSTGQYFSQEAFGHLGYTGTSVWVDPVHQGVAVLLTNRVHPSRVDERIRLIRPRFHDAVFRIWQGKGKQA